ncbi:DUF4331 family protein [Robertkochia solimangrovi]|uniref:DUF4331 family protein n=1 Tax=Robertkochia solimangrovi TaxID=2213046 RepID=UPI00117DDDBE|nr:DUF4331 family protein [Robertkochia solimangrovi]TRZ45425.1 hypothetical protein DMZ48_04740 [Robertkochia solimangrovi]
MKNNLFSIFTLLLCLSILLTSCSNDDDNNDYMMPAEPDFSGSYTQMDQMGRPAVNTVFVSSDAKDMFNVTTPSDQQSEFQSMFESNLTALSPAYANPGDMNALGQDAAAFTGLLATDVLNVSLEGTTTFYDGTNILTGRNLSDDVITVELLLIFGGEDFTENPSLSDDHVDANDKDFLTSFPYLAAPW